MNKLANESSLYLQQHTDNPVDWWPWGPEALAAARSSGKPILLSIGYAACHWCHVMAHESFENETTAALMNEHFINIKVDREQRPDLDRIYQAAHQLIVQRPGGWPLTMFLTPDEQLPFFGGTYFPPEAQQGMPAFADVLSKVAEFHAASPAEAARQGGAVRDVFAKLEPDDKPAASIDVIQKKLRTALGQHADRQHGGFGKAPKFPQTPSLLWLLRHWRSTAHEKEPDVDALFMTALAQARMAEGGLMDQIGGGFYRYCVDGAWQIPHFEKMLYDNAQLLTLYSDSCQATGEPVFRDAATQLVNWLLNTMQSPTGGFYASIDADSEGGEGRYYTWTVDELRACLDDDTFALVHTMFGLEGVANFEGRWHVTMSAPFTEVAQQLGEDDAALERKRAMLRKTLLDVRDDRPAPAIDQKILTAHNAMTITALVRAAIVFERDDWFLQAQRCYTFLRASVIDAHGPRASWQDGHARPEVFLDDYVHLIDALLHLLSVEWRDAWLADATRLADQMIERFADEATGGLYFTPHDHEALMVRQKPIADEALPAGNAVAVSVLSRLGHVLGNTRYLSVARGIVDYAAPAMDEFPEAHVSLIDAATALAQEPETIVLRGDDAQCRQWHRDLQKIYAPNRWTVVVPESGALPNALSDKPLPESGALAYLCRGMHCEAPISEWSALAAAVRGR